MEEGRRDGAEWNGKVEWKENVKGSVRERTNWRWVIQFSVSGLKL